MSVSYQKHIDSRVILVQHSFISCHAAIKDSHRLPLLSSQFENRQQNGTQTEHKQIRYTQKHTTRGHIQIKTPNRATTTTTDVQIIIEYARSPIGTWNCHTDGGFA